MKAHTQNSCQVMPGRKQCIKTHNFGKKQIERNGRSFANAKVAIG